MVKHHISGRGPVLWMKWLPLLLLAVGFAAAGPIPHDDDDLEYRLDGSVVPVQYHIHLTPNIPDGTFTGEVTIEIEAVRASRRIILHAQGIDFGTISVKDGEGIELYQGRGTNDDYELLIIDLSEDLKENEEYTISIDYGGTLRDNMQGFYVSKYTRDELEYEVAATQFQPTHARKAFPCFDEPSYKARFQLTIDVQAGYTALSNMKTTEESTEDVYTFENSLIMSSYLVAFAVVDFQQYAVEETSPITYGYWARPGLIERLEYASLVTPDLLRELEEYTGIPYTQSDGETQLTQLDQIGLPDFNAGAMENWGLITYRERYLLFNDGTQDDRMLVAIVIAHELAHMWFGNLVTTKWWETTWLNEGFATYFEVYITNNVEKNFLVMDQFLVDHLQRALLLDAEESSLPLTTPADSAAQVSNSFRTITYSKGGSVLRMVSSMIGEDNFKDAIRSYLEEYQFQSVQPEHLFNHLKKHYEAAGLDSEGEMEEFLLCWTTIRGFPVVHVTRNYIDNSARVTQKRFLYSGEGPELYYVPLTWTKEGQNVDEQNPTLYLKNSGVDIEEDLGGPEAWVIFNVQEQGYYRVNYDERNWDLITKYLQNFDHDLDNIDMLNRAQLLDDAFNLARAGQLPYAIAFELANYLPREQEFVPWVSALTSFAYLDRMFASHPKYPVLQKYIRRLAIRQYSRFDFGHRESGAGEYDGKQLLNRISSWTCAVGEEGCNTRAPEELEHLLGGGTVEADLRSVVYCHGIKNSDDLTWDKLWKIYEESDDDAERPRLAAGLACSKNIVLLQRLLQYVIDRVHIRRQDATSVFSSVYSSPIGAEATLEFLDLNFPQVRDYFGSVNSIVIGIANRFTTAAQKEKLQAFVEKHSEELETVGWDAVQTVQDNIDWISKNEDAIFDYLERRELEQYRLPENVEPERYTLSLTPHLETNTFDGDVTINVKVVITTDTIVLHAGDIEVEEISVRSEDDNVEIYYSQDPEQELLKIYTKNTFAKGDYNIRIEYKGTLRDDMYGFYISTYRDEDGNPRKIAATQFQPTHARKAFPCFDEPQYKATFHITINNPPGYHSLSNMPAEDESEETKTEFYESVKMSTYLVAFVVSDFEFIEDREEGEVLFKTWSRPDALEWGKYSIQISRSILNALEDYTGIDYLSFHTNLDKVDQVAIPDFSAGAMENWGLITYRETALLYNQGTAAARKSVATIIAHELVHMWFGNLVTTKWWDATWLNEGFAQFFQFYAVDVVKPDWRIMEQFLVDHHQMVMRADALATSAALTSEAFTPAQVMSRFSTITYSKGAAVLRMLRSILGDNTFQTALRNYLDDHKYEETVPEDLFESIKDHTPSSVLSRDEMEALLRSWTEQPGFPVIEVKRNGNTATVTQKRFLANGGDDPTLYYVPLTWTQQGENFEDRRPQAYITNTESTIILENMPSPDAWVIFNVQETGYYRVKYDERNWELIGNYLDDVTHSLDDIHVLNRAQLVDDALNLARVGQIEYETALHVVDYLAREVDFIPWTAAITAFNFLEIMLSEHERYEEFENYIKYLLHHQYERFLFRDQEDHDLKLLLNRVTTLACNVGHTRCTQSAEKSLEDYLDGIEPIPADLKSVAYCYGVRNSPHNWNRLWQKYTESLDDAERALIARGLGCSTDVDILKEYLKYSINGEHIRKQDASSVFSAVYTTRAGVEVALDFLDEEFDAIQNYYGSMGAINNIVTGIAERLTTENQQTKLQEFVSKHEDELGSAGAAANERVKENLNWIEEHSDTIIKIVEDKGYTTPATSVEETTTSEVTTEVATTGETTEDITESTTHPTDTTEGTQDTTTEGSEDPTTEGSEDTTTEGLEDTTTEGSEDTTTEGSEDTTTEGSEDTTTEGSEDTTTEGIRYTTTEGTTGYTTTEGTTGSTTTEGTTGSTTTEGTTGSTTTEGTTGDTTTEGTTGDTTTKRTAEDTTTKRTAEDTTEATTETTTEGTTTPASAVSIKGTTMAIVLAISVLFLFSRH